jgi:hypothetical protein
MAYPGTLICYFDAELVHYIRKIDRQVRRRYNSKRSRLARNTFLRWRNQRRKPRWC